MGDCCPRRVRGLVVVAQRNVPPVRPFTLVLGPVGAAAPAAAERPCGQKSSSEASPGEFGPYFGQDSGGERSLVEFCP